MTSLQIGRQRPRPLPEPLANPTSPSTQLNDADVDSKGDTRSLDYSSCGP